MLKIFLQFSLIVLSVLTTVFCYAEGESRAATMPAAGTQAKPIKATPGMYYFAGEKFYNAFKYDAALKYYSYCVRLDKNYLAAWKKIAFCYYKLNKHGNAFAAFKKVLALDKNDKDAQEFMSYYGSLIAKTKKQKEKREVVDSLWRAAVLPGWGQFFNNQSMKGIIISAGAIISGGMTAYSIVDQNNKYDKYISANENHDIAYKEAEAAWTTVLIWTIVTAVIYAGGIVDAAMNYDCEESKMIEAKINNEGVFTVCANIRW